MAAWMFSFHQILIPSQKFRIEASFELTKILPKLGITKIFDRSANFSGIFEDGGDGVFVSDVIHKAFVEVNEEGTEAAAATAIMMTRMLLTGYQLSTGW
jgi:serpin B